MNLLTLSGSLRRGSLNSALLREALGFLPDSAVTSTFDIASLPHFDQDLEAEPPQSVVEFRDAVRRADAIVMATPQYNGSVSGVLKNAIDWVSRPTGAGAITGKRVVALGASPSPRGASWAVEDLRKILRVAGADVAPESLAVDRAHQVLGIDFAASPDGEQLRRIVVELPAA